MVGMRGEWTRPFGTWLALGAYAPGSERQPLDTAKLHVVPTADVRSGPIACGPTKSRGPGACLVFGTSGEPVFTRCFTLAEIKAGRAFTLVDVSGKGARLLGLVPDGVATGRLHDRQRVRAAPGARERGPGLHRRLEGDGRRHDASSTRASRRCWCSTRPASRGWPPRPRRRCAGSASTRYADTVPAARREAETVVQGHASGRRGRSLAAWPSCSARASSRAATSALERSGSSPTSWCRLGTDRMR